MTLPHRPGYVAVHGHPEGLQCTTLCRHEPVEPWWSVLATVIVTSGVVGLIFLLLWCCYQLAIR